MMIKIKIIARFALICKKTQYQIILNKRFEIKVNQRERGFSCCSNNLNLSIYLDQSQK